MSPRAGELPGQTSFPWGTTARSRKTDPETSRAAASSMQAIVPTHHALICQILANGPMIPEEIADHTDGQLQRYEVCKRMKELERLGRVEVCGEGRNRNGRKARKWRLV